MPKDTTIAAVAKCIASVLAKDPAEIHAEARFTKDLGGDSLDLVELMFLLEQEFGITLSEKDMSLSDQLGLPEEDVHHNERLTAKAAELLCAQHPQAASWLKEGTLRKDLVALVTATAVARTVERKLNPVV